MNALLIQLFTIFLATYLLSTDCNAYSSYNDELECAEKDYHNRTALSCVSKASIEKDKAQLKLIKLQIEKIKKDLKAMEEGKK